ncbi:resistin-like beta [Otolemur garnettii]|uniref:Resistin like beta n=1 Tax=Otolemur garnettii TaxID=30611 RepID=H0X9K1_OTOGA|nr:resistin-like beta [Otolemur garnettii]
MKPTICLLLILIPLLQLIIPGSTEYSLEATVEKKIKEFLNSPEYKPPAVAMKISCTSVKQSGKFASCPHGMSVTGCACGYGCGSWDIRQETTCHCQCPGMDWTAARCCQVA